MGLLWKGKPKLKPSIPTIPTTICNVCKNTGEYEDDYFGKIKCTYCDIWDKKHPPKLDLTPVATKPNCWKCKDTGYHNDSYWGDTVPCTSCNIHKNKEKEQLDKKAAEWEQWKAKYLNNAEEQVKKKPGDNEIVPAKPNQLQLDYDQEKIPEQFSNMLSILQKRFGCDKALKWEETISSSGKHIHIVVTLPEDIDNMERVAWQSVFGSDPMREALSILRITNNISDPSVLFMPKKRVVVECGVLEARPGRKFKDD